MKAFLWLTALTLTFLLTACAKDPELEKMRALYDKYDTHCREHARGMVAEVDEEERYDECMTYLISTDPDCPYDNKEPYMSKADN